MRQLVWRDTLAVEVPTDWTVREREGERSLGVLVPGGGELTIVCARRVLDEDDDDTELAYMLAMDAAAKNDWDLERLRIAEFAVDGCPAAEVATTDGSVSRRVWHIVGRERVCLVTLEEPATRVGDDAVDRLVRSIRWLHSAIN